MKFLAILIYIVVVLIRIDIIPLPYLDDNDKSLLFIVSTLLIPTFIVRPLINNSTKNLTPLKIDKILNKQLDLPHNINIYEKKSNLNRGIYTKGSFFKHSIIIDPKLLKKLDSSHLEFLIYHEVAHIKNHDITKLQFLFAFFYAVFPALLILASGGINFSELYLFIMYVVFCVIIYISGILFYFHLKRLREFKCDIYATKYVSRQDSINSLRKLKEIGILKDTPLLIFSDHPNLEARIKNLKNNSYLK